MTTLMGLVYQALLEAGLKLKLPWALYEHLCSIQHKQVNPCISVFNNNFIAIFPTERLPETTAKIIYPSSTRDIHHLCWTNITFNLQANHVTPCNDQAFKLKLKFRELISCFCCVQTSHGGQLGQQQNINRKWALSTKIWVYRLGDDGKQKRLVQECRVWKLTNFL